MRIIGGEARGRTLYTPEGLDTRPTADRIRESLFSIISAEVRDARVLDLFAGSGALALEAISRGARYAALNDISRVATKVIARNVDMVRAQDRVEVLCMDWRAALNRLREQSFSLVFLDPPYRMTEVYAEVLVTMRIMNMLEPGSLLCLEHDARSEIGLPGGFKLVDQRKYGDTKISFAKEEADTFDRIVSRQL